MSESGDKEYPVSDYDYLATRAILLTNITLLRNELNLLWEKGRHWEDKRFERHLHTIAERRMEILNIAHGLMPSEEYKKYEDFVNLILPTEYSKLFDFKKLGSKKRKF